MMMSAILTLLYQCGGAGGGLKQLVVGRRFWTTGFDRRVPLRALATFAFNSSFHSGFLIDVYPAVHTSKHIDVVVGIVPIYKGQFIRTWIYWMRQRSVAGMLEVSS